jgi:hypothetical protein
MSAKPFTSKVKQVKIVLSPSTEDYKSIRFQYEQQTGTNNTYDKPDVWDSLIAKFAKALIVENISLTEAEAIAEPIRIMFPDQHVNIYGDDNSYIGNVTWNDQMKMFWEYPTYTDLGNKLRENRMAEAKQLNLIASWE